jgi:hypothetical protein
LIDGAVSMLRLRLGLMADSIGPIFFYQADLLVTAGEFCHRLDSNTRGDSR